MQTIVMSFPRKRESRIAITPNNRRSSRPREENLMKPLAIFVLIASASAAIADPKPQYGGFSPDADGQQAYLDYIHSLDMIEIEAGPELQKAIEAIPVEAGVSITPEQEAGLRDWLYDFLVAFSASGSDSLAAAFYLREGVNNPTGIQEIKAQFAAFANAPADQLKSMGMAPPKQPVDDTPFALFQAMHRFGVNVKGRDYFLGNASFFDSAYRVFALQGAYESYATYATSHGLLPTGGRTEWSPKLRKEMEERLKAGEPEVAAEFMFIAEEPEECADFETGPLRFPFFVRLVWSSEKAIWRLVEAFAPNDAPVLFLFKST